MTRREKAQELVESLPDDIGASVDDIEDSLDQLVDEFNVPIEEAVRSTRSKYMGDYDGDGEVTSSGPSSAQDEDVNIGDLTVDHDEEWMNIQGTVQQLFELSEKQTSWISQRGVIGDDTGTTIFTTPKEAVEEDPDLELEKGQTYKLQGVVGDAHRGNIGVKITSTTSGSTLDNAFTPPDNDTHLTGCIVDIQEGSGLIKRCPEDDCTYIVTNGNCQQHGSVEGDFDLRLKTIIDDGEQPHQVFFGREATEVLTGVSLDDAITIAEDAVDTGAVADEMEDMLLGRYYSIAGNKVGEYVIVNEFERVNRDWASEARELLDSFSGTDEVAA